MRDVLLAEVTLKIKKTWHIKWQLKSVKFGGYVFLFLFLLFFSFSSFNQLVVSQFVSFWLCLRGDTANVKSSAPGSSSFSSFFLFFSFLLCTGGQERPCSGLQASLALALSLACSVLSWMSLQSPCSECDCVMSTPRCRGDALRQMRQAASPSAPSQAPCCPLVSRVPSQVPYLRRAGHCSLSMVANQPEHCTRVLA